MMASSGGLYLLLSLQLFYVSTQAFQHDRFTRQAESGWSEWSVGSVCSRSCGGGVSYQERYCLEGYGTCLGPHRTYRSCQIQDCPEDALDFRTEQCASYNEVLYEGRLFKWVPYEGGPNKCELNCMPKGEHFYYRRAEKVIDGTRCTSDSLDICVDGLCRHVGCDMLLDSNAVEDKCGECGGDNSTCRLVEGKFVRRKLPEGYNDIHIIPAGATNGRIAEMRGSQNYLALRNRFEEFYLNGDFSIDLPHSFQAAGTNINYARKLGSPNNSPEIITFPGPTDEHLFVVLLTQGRNHGIEYSYYVPNGVGPDEPVSYSWSYDKYSNCSKECGGGHQIRTVTCTRSGDYDPVPTYLCDPALKPRTNRTCNADACPPRWFIGEWSPCSRTCDEGTQVRQVFCQQLLENGRTEPIDEDYCLGVLGDKPEYQQACTVRRCPRWVAGEWGECSAECGDGVQSRQVQCVADLPEPERSCSRDERPEEDQNCNLGPCDGVDWLTTQWTECTGLCGYGSRSRQLFCGTRAGTVVEKDLCDMDIMPDMTASCPLQSECGPHWVATHWSQCSTTCGGGIHSRLVFCADVRSGGSFSQVSDANCNASTKFETEEVCNTEMCSEDYVWFLGPWGKCTVPCSGGTRTRALMCMKGETPQRQSLCEADIRPITTEQCNMGPCSQDILQDTGNGVHCDGSEFGCCEDGVTTASGPFKEGCRECEATEFRCCPDGITPAKGENYGGCEVTETEELFTETEQSIALPSHNEDDPCMLSIDPGICRAWVVKYFFDVNYGQCTQFWYGGCGGNANLFDSYDDCSSECVGDDQKLTQEELCILPMVEGPCKGSHSSYYYNIKSGRCETFKYGGCRGNQNRFRTEADCEIACGTFNSDHCTLQPEYGNCRDSEVRWFFNVISGMCEDFEYSGCLGNQNRFMDKQTCEESCNANIPDSGRYLSKYDRCRMPSEAGWCDDAITQWTYDVKEGKCTEFVYSGCDGNDNRFDTELSCQESCYVEGKTLCERMQGLFESSGIQDEPQCKFDGSFEPVQCPPRTGDCWCVTDVGEEIEGSRITRQLHTLRPDCSIYENSAGNTKSYVSPTTTQDMATMTLCEQHQHTAQGSYVPQCTLIGEYEPMQCYGSNMDYCWCVNENGEEMDFTRTLPGQDKPECVGILNSVCFRAYRAVMLGQVESAYMPQCTPQGLFARLQCHTERGCLCVDEMSGTALFSVDINPETATPATCDGTSTKVLSVCETHRQETLAASEGSPSYQTQYIPLCNADGSYAEVQCYNGQAMYCWCVNEQGEEIANTRQRGTEPDCTGSGSVLVGDLELPSVINLVTESVEAVTVYEQDSDLDAETTTVITTTRAAILDPETTTTEPSIPDVFTTTRASVIDRDSTVTQAAILDKDITIIGEGEDGELGDPDEYECTDSSNCLGASSASISQSPSTVVARPGNMVVLTCEAQGTPTPSIRWERNGQDVAAMNNARLVVSEDGTLNILNARVEDSGPYLCVADNGIGEPDRATFEIRVSERPNRPLARQSRIRVHEGKSVTMNCRARGTPTPTITWEFQGLELSDIETRVTKLPSGSLRVSDVGLSDVGTYKCTARNMYGIIQMRTFTLIVEAEVKIVDPPASQKATEGEVVTLRCGTTGSPKPNIRWMVDNSPIPTLQRFTIGAYDELIIQDIKMSDSGRYSCTAANGISSKSAYAEVTVQGGNEVDPNCQDQPQYVSCELIVFAKLCTKSRYYNFCCRTCRDNGMIPLTTPAP